LESLGEAERTIKRWSTSIIVDCGPSKSNVLPTKALDLEMLEARCMESDKSHSHDGMEGQGLGRISFPIPHLFLPPITSLSIGSTMLSTLLRS
jgi:hypothetical protein